MCPNRCKGTGVIDSNILRDPGADSQGSQTGQSGVNKVNNFTQLTSTDLTFCPWVSKNELHSCKGDFLRKMTWSLLHLWDQNS